MAIKEWVAADRPREKLIQRGARNLTDSELLAILLGSGTTQHNAVTLAQELLARFGGLKPLSQLSFHRLDEFKGMGPARYARLQAGLEIGRRTLLDVPNLIGEPLSDSKTAAKYVKNALFSLPREIFACLMLDTRHRILAFEVIAEGTIDRAAVYPREVVRKIIDHNAAAVILCHNHPSGNPNPSEADKALTRQLCAALALIDVNVLDHFLVAGTECTSFADLGLMT